MPENLATRAVPTTGFTVHLRDRCFSFDRPKECIGMLGGSVLVGEVVTETVEEVCFPGVSN